jgi:hypothetical protein
LTLLACLVKKIIIIVCCPSSLFLLLLTHSLSHRPSHRIEIITSAHPSPRHRNTSVPASYLHYPRRTFQTHKPAFTCLELAPALEVVATLHYTSVPLSHTYKTPRHQHGPHHCCSGLAPRGVQEAERYVSIATTCIVAENPPTHTPTSQASSRTRTPSSRPLPTLASRLPVSALRTAPSPTCLAPP